VGLIEYNRYKFSAELREEGPFGLRGLRVVRKTSFRSVSRYQVDNATCFMIRRQIENRPEEILRELTEGHRENGYSRPRSPERGISASRTTDLTV
jgi:hypothetical protein